MSVAPLSIIAPDLVTIKRALLSVSDKSGIIDLAKALSEKGVELVSTGGTRADHCRGRHSGQGYL